MRNGRAAKGISTWSAGALVALCGLFALASCAGPTPYQPETNGAGYAEQRLEANRFRVSFTGNAETPRKRVEDYLMYRAAELTLAHGKDYFVIAHRDTEAMYEDDGGSGFGGFIGHGYGGPYSRTITGFSYEPGWGLREYRAYVDIVIRSGRKPANDPNAYDAREVRANLAPTIQRPVN